MRRTKTNERDPSRVVHYRRVSSQAQAASGLSLDAQRRELLAHAEASSLHVEKDYEDAGFSGTTDARPSFQHMMADVLSPASRVGQILVTHGTRFFRDTHLAAFYRAKLGQAGIKLLAIQQPEGEGPAGELMAHLMDGIAQFESRTNATRVFSGMSQSAREGFWPHAIPPFGYRIEKVEYKGKLRNRLSPHLSESEVVRQIFNLYQSGQGGQAVAQYLNAEGITRRGSRWNRDNVLKTLGDTTAKGIATWGKRESRSGRVRPESEWIKIAVEPVVSQEAFERVQQLRAERDPVKNPGRASSSPLLLGGGVAKCGHCGSSLELQTSGKKRPDGSDYRFYCCSKARRQGRAACPESKPIPVEELDQEVMSQVANRAFSEARARRILGRLCQGPLRDSRERDIARVRRVLENLSAKKSRLIDAVADGTINGGDVRDKLASLDAEIVNREAALQPLRAALPTKVVPRSLVKRFMRRGQKALMNNEEVRRGYASRALRRVTVPRAEIETS